MQYGEGCTSKRPCRRFRACQYCARLRQARFADLAEQVLGEKGAITLLRLTPYHNIQSEITRLKAAWKRQNPEKSAVWTVEQGSEKGLLHLNILQQGIDTARYKQAERWQSEQITELRRIAAYLLKQSQYPDETAYTGRQFGSFTSLASTMISDGMPPLLQAACIENQVLTHMQLPAPYLARQAELEQLRRDQTDYRAIAMRHLPKFRAVVESLKGTIKEDEK